MEDTMEIWHVNKKGNMMNTLEKFHIYNTRLDNQVNERDPVKHNVTVDFIANI